MFLSQAGQEIRANYRVLAVPMEQRVTELVSVKMVRLAVLQMGLALVLLVSQETGQFLYFTLLFIKGVM